MSLTALRRPVAGGYLSGTRVAQLALALGAIALVGGIVTLLVWLAAPPVPPPTRNPFGMGMREAAPSAGAFGQLVLRYQSAFSLMLRDALGAIRTDPAAAWSLVTIGFAYGVFHAAGPGHGKAVISSYIMAGENALRRGVGLSFAAAFIQAIVAMALVGAVFVIARGTAATMARTANAVELVGFALVAALGLTMTWRKAGQVLQRLARARPPKAAGIAPGDACDCDHVHMPAPERLVRSSPREMAAIALGAGIRPCAGAILILVLAMSQNLMFAGLAAVLAMAAGTAVTTSAIAALAVYAKRLALRLAGGRGTAGAIAVAGLELAAAAFVVVLGVSLLTGFWSGERTL